jgi:hypothetical protein
MQSSLDASKADLQSVLENGGGVLEQEESGLQGSKAAGEGKLWFVAAHAWDLAGAKKGGYVPRPLTSWLHLPTRSRADSGFCFPPVTVVS